MHSDFIECADKTKQFLGNWKLREYSQKLILEQIMAENKTIPCTATWKQTNNCFNKILPEVSTVVFNVCRTLCCSLHALGLTHCLLHAVKPEEKSWWSVVVVISQINFDKNLFWQTAVTKKTLWVCVCYSTHGHGYHTFPEGQCIMLMQVGVMRWDDVRCCCDAAVMLLCCVKDNKTSVCWKARISELFVKLNGCCLEEH